MVSRTWRPLTALLLIVAVLLASFAAPRPSAAQPAGRRAPARAAASQPKRPPVPRKPIARPDGTIDVGPALRGKQLPLDAQPLAPGMRPSAAETVSYTVGMTRTFVVLNDVAGRYQLATYQVRLIHDLVEVWVQTDLRYRNPDGSVNIVHPNASDPKYITNERIAALAAEAEKIIPTDVAYFGDYASRAGNNSVLTELLGLPPGYYGGPGKRVIILVSNVRDANFYDPVNNPSYIAGFYSGQVNAFADRNIITVDSKAWNVNVGAPRYQVESTIAHEFQHLINADTDPDGEDTWANEGRSEFAEFVNGYRPPIDPNIATLPDETSHRGEWSDFPENSLTLWGDQDADPDQSYEILADYQEAYWFFLYLAGRLKAAGIDVANDQFVKDVAGLTRDPANGIESIDAMLARVGAPFRFRQVWNDFRVDMLYGGTSDQTAWGSYISQWHSPTNDVPVAPLDLGRMRRNLNFEGYDTPGAPPYGSDYIEIGWSPAISGSANLNFNGDTSPVATAWRVVPASSVGITPTGAVSGNVLYSGHTDMTDNFLIFPVTVPASGNQTLAFDTLYNIEEGWDFGFTQVTTDTTGATGFTSLPISGTTTISNTDAQPIIKANVPGFTGLSGVPVPADPATDKPAWVHVTYNLSAYAGKSILLAFRYSTDPATAGTIDPPPEPGWYLDNVTVGGTALYTDQASVPASAKSIWQARGKGNQFQLNFVTFADKNGPAITNVYTATLDVAGDGTFDLASLTSNPGFNEPGERVVALVSVIPPAPEPDLVGGSPAEYGAYKLTGLPPSVYTSRARAIGSASNTSLRRPTVYPGDRFTVTVTVDDLGRNDDLSAAPTPAYVAVPIPPNTTFVTDTLTSTVELANMRYVDDLHAVDSGLPAGPGVYWHGTVTKTADLAFDLRVAQPITTSATIDPYRTSTMIAPVAHIANGPFGSNPSQSFTDLYEPVRVVSPLELSTAAGPAQVQPGSTAVFTYTLVNTDDRAREVDFHAKLPSGTTLLGLTAGVGVPETQAARPGAEVKLRLSVPSYVETGNVMTVVMTVGVDAGFSGTLKPQVEVLQPGSSLPYAVLDASSSPGGAPNPTPRAYLPLVYR